MEPSCYDSGLAAASAKTTFIQFLLKSENIHKILEKIWVA